MLQQDGVVVMVMKVLVAMISPLWEGIFLADFCLPESFLSLCVFCPADAAKSFCDPPPSLRFLGRRYTQRGWQRWARVDTPPGGAA
jgi:hypothetical protein